MRRGVLLLSSLAALARLGEASASPPCAGCVLEGAPDRSRPLLVLLHGDEGDPQRLARAWSPVAKAHGMVLLAPKCPRDLGCSTGSFWRWGQAPDWLFALVERVAAEQPIDPERRYLAGWSGGATYMGMHAARWPSRFAALSFAGGGVPPSDPGCASPGPSATDRCAPVHYLAGDKNPLFGLAVSTREHLRRCGHDVTWDLHRGADHGGEWLAYERGLDDVATFLEGSAGRCRPPQPAPPRSSGSALASPVVPASEAATRPPREPPREPSGAPAPKPQACGCQAGAGVPSSPGLGIPLLALSLAGLLARRCGRERLVPERPEARAETPPFLA